MSVIRNLKKDKKGFLVLTMVILVSATVLIIATGSLLRSITEMNQSTDSENSLKAFSVTSSCGEYALLNMMASSTSSSTTATNWIYAGSLQKSLDVGDETCYINTVASGTSRVIKTFSTVSSFTKKMQIIVATNTPKVLVTSWKEVADF